MLPYLNCQLRSVMIFYGNKLLRTECTTQVQTWNPHTNTPLCSHPHPPTTHSHTHAQMHTIAIAIAHCSLPVPSTCWHWRILLKQPRQSLVRYNICFVIAIYLLDSSYPYTLSTTIRCTHLIPTRSNLLLLLFLKHLIQRTGITISLIKIAPRKKNHTHIHTRIRKNKTKKPSRFKPRMPAILEIGAHHHIAYGDSGLLSNAVLT